MVHTADKDTDFLNTVAGVLQGDTLAPFLLIICQDYVLRMSIDLIKENGFTLKEKQTRSTRYLAETVTYAHCADDLALFANTPVRTESSWHSLDVI